MSSNIDKFVRRIFYRGRWYFGGRFHGGWWQQIGKEWRKQIYINDDSTVEQDYSGLHINLLYALVGQAQPDDTYDLNPISFIDLDDQRNLVKSLALVTINSSSEKQAFRAFRYKQGKGSRYKKLKNKELSFILDAFKEKHKSIESYMCSDYGVKLMNLDGKITAYIINHFTTNNIPILTIHDSYITTNDKTLELQKTMNNAINEIVGGAGIKIDQGEKGIVDIAFEALDQKKKNQ